MKYYFCLVIFYFFTACTNHSTPKEETKTAPKIDSIITVKDSIHRMKLTFVGDIMGHREQIYSAAGSKANFKSKNMADFDYEPCFRYIKPILQQADLAMGNLEVTLTNKGKYKGYPMFRSPDKLAYDLKDAGFDFLTTCNNHSNDGFIYGINHTIDVLDSLGFYYTGTFKNSKERAEKYPLIIEKKVDGTHFKLAFINYTFSTNGIKTRPPTIVNRIGDSLILADIAKAKKAKPDMIIAIMHWGREYKLEAYKREIKRTKWLWKNGVDVVIGGHPHVIEPIKSDAFYNEDSTELKEKLVTYSLGNFISNQSRPNTDIGLIFELELVKNSRTNQTVIGRHDYIFAWRYIHNPSTDIFAATHTIVPVSAFEANADTLLFMPLKDYKNMLSTTNRMRRHLLQWQSEERIVRLSELGKLKSISYRKQSLNK